MINPLAAQISVGKLVAYGAVALGLLAAGDHFGSGRVQARWDAASLEAANAYAAALRADQERSQAVSEGYQNELERLRVAADKPARVVRVFVPSPNDPANPATGTDGPGEGSGAGTAGKDIGSGLFAIADDLDLCKARLDALQAWAKE